MISVCIATYNGAPYITEQLASICAQLSDNDEIIISDDGSTDSTLDVVRAFGDPRIRIVRNQSQRCYTANFENALRHAQGDYIFICDQDDVWLPNKVETIVHYLCDEGYSIVAHDAIVTDAHPICWPPSCKLPAIAWGFLRRPILLISASAYASMAKPSNSSMSSIGSKSGRPVKPHLCARIMLRIP